MIRLGGPVLGLEELQAIEAVLNSGQLVQAREVAAFEGALAAYLGANTIAVSSGTAALHVALLALGIGPGDIVVVPTYSWPATANVVEALGARAMFVDIDEGDFNLDPEALVALLERLCNASESRGRVKAVIAVHAFGALGKVEAIETICARYEVPLIEDAACALGSRLGEHQPGNWGLLSCYSFHPRKLVTTAEGGAVTTRDEALQSRIKAWRNHGLDALATTGPEFILPGLNYRMSEIHAALGRCQLARLDDIVKTRRKQAGVYAAALSDSGVRWQQVRKDCYHNIQSYVVTLPYDDAHLRDALVALMREQKIETTIGTWHIPMTGYYRSRYNYQPGDFPVTDRVFASAMTLPLTHAMTEKEQVATIECLLTGLKKLKAQA